MSLTALKVLPQKVMGPDYAGSEWLFGVLPNLFVEIGSTVENNMLFSLGGVKVSTGIAMTCAIRGLVTPKLRLFNGTALLNIKLSACLIGVTLSKKLVLNLELRSDTQSDILTGWLWG